eukprot:jgi/Picsp_1/2967/NSC_01191-R1_polysaccharide pyruvyl transferase
MIQASKFVSAGLMVKMDWSARPCLKRTLLASILLVQVVFILSCVSMLSQDVRKYAFGSRMVQIVTNPVAAILNDTSSQVLWQEHSESSKDSDQKVQHEAWVRPLGQLSSAAVERINCMRNKVFKSDLGRLKFFDPKIPEEIEGTMVHCMGNGFDLEHRLLVVTSIDASVMHLMPAYLNMVSDRSNNNTEILLMATGIEFYQIERMCAFLNQQGLPTPVHVLLLSENTLDSFFKYETEQRGILKHVPIATMSRLLLPSLMSGVAETILYLDVDIVLADELELSKAVVLEMCPGFDESVPGVCGRESFQSNVRNWCDGQTIRILGLGGIDRGFNAGVLVLNLTRMNEFGFSRYAVVVSRSFGVNDQVILVAYTKDKYSKMVREFNIFDGQDPERNAGKIIHFAGQNRKPWYPWSRGYSTWSSYEYPLWLLLWSSFDPIPMELVDSLVQYCHGRPGIVYCASSTCYEQVSKVGYPLIAYKNTFLRYRMKDPTPLQGFFSKLQLYKILMGDAFPEIFSIALKLNILYRHGGLLVPSASKMIQEIPETHLSKTSIYWFGESLDANDFTIFANAKDERVLKLMENFMSGIESNCLRKVNIDGDASCSELAQRSIFAPKQSNFRYYKYFQDIVHTSEVRKHYAVLWYDIRVRNNQPYPSKIVANVGDEIQSLASASWLPYVDAHVERDNLNSALLDKFPERGVKTFMNGWYGSKNMPWPPSKSIDPISLAMHIEPSVFHVFASNSSLKYLTANGALVGARDTSTETFLSSNGVRTFFSGCMTLTTYRIKNSESRTPDCDYLFVDISDNAYAQLPEHVKRNAACRVSHRLEGDTDVLRGKVRFVKAFQMLQSYSSAKVVVTSRLHSALPASSMGVTVIMVQSLHLPGGGSGKDNNRFSGLDKIFFTVEEENMQRRLYGFNWKEPPSNPGASLIQKFRCNIVAFLKQYHNDVMDAVGVFDLHGVFDSCN